MAAPIADLPTGPNVKLLLPVKPRNAPPTNWRSVATIRPYRARPTLSDFTRRNNKLQSAPPNAYPGGAVLNGRWTGATPWVTNKGEVPACVPSAALRTYSPNVPLRRTVDVFRRSCSRVSEGIGQQVTALFLLT